MLEPDGLICDEPVSMLDTSVRAQILRVLVGLRQKRGLALIFITHDLSLAWSLCDRIAVMYLGRVVEQGEAAAVIERPAASLHAGAGRRGPGRDAGRRRRPRSCSAARSPTRPSIPTGCRFHPRCPRRFDACDTSDPHCSICRRSRRRRRSGRGRAAAVACRLYEAEQVSDPPDPPAADRGG